MKILSSLLENPILARSLDNRRLSWRVVAALGLALLTYSPAGVVILSLIIATLGIILLNPNELFDIATQFLANNLDEVGRTVFLISALFALICVTLFSPTLSAGTIAGERQRQTLDLLLITLLPARSIIAGKLGAALIYTLLLIAAVWPLFLLCLLTGGVALIELGVILLLLLTTAVAFSAIGIFVSSLSRSITTAMMLTYGVALPLFFIGPFLGMLPVTILLNLIDASYEFQTWVNFYGWSLAASLNPISAAVYSAILRETWGGFLVAAVETDGTYYLIFPWLTYIIFYSFMAWFLMRLTIRRLEKVSQ